MNTECKRCGEENHEDLLKITGLCESCDEDRNGWYEK